MRGTFEHFDARPGGSYRLRLAYRDPAEAPGKSTADSDVVNVRFVEIEQNERVVQAVDFESDDPSFRGTMTMTWLVAPVDGGTRVTVTATDVPAGISQEDHLKGFESSLDNLAEFLRSS